MKMIIAERLKPYLTEILHQNQYCRIQGKTVFEGVAAIRDVIDHAEITRKPLCVVFIDFSEAFDNISHENLQKVLHSHAFSESFIRRIMHLYNKATSKILVNGFRTWQIRIKRSVRQG